MAAILLFVGDRVFVHSLGLLGISVLFFLGVSSFGAALMYKQKRLGTERVFWNIYSIQSLIGILFFLIGLGMVIYYNVTSNWWFLLSRSPLVANG